METELQSVGRAFGAHPAMLITRVFVYPDKYITRQYDGQKVVSEREWRDPDDMKEFQAFCEEWFQRAGDRKTYATIEKVDGR